MTRDKWLAQRRGGIGSSDAAALLGISRWSTPYSVYLDKTGQLPDLPPNPAMEWGNRLEEAIATAYAERTGERLEDTTHRVFQHPTHPWMLATPDRLTEGGRVVEVKTASAWSADEWGEPGTDEVPDVYLVQVNHQLAVLGLEQADVAVLIGGQDFRVYHVARNDRLIRHLIAVEESFWDRVQTRQPPEPTWTHPETPAVLEALYPPEESVSCDLDDSALQWVRLYEDMGERSRTAAEERAVAKARLIHLMGSASLARLPDGREVVRKTVRRKAYSVGAGEYNSFRIKQPKPSKEEKYL